MKISQSPLKGNTHWEILKTRWSNPLEVQSAPVQTGLGFAFCFNAAIRSHWGIENSLHWVLDVQFDEDRCQKRMSASWDE